MRTHAQLVCLAFALGAPGTLSLRVAAPMVDSLMAAFDYRAAPRASAVKGSLDTQAASDDLDFFERENRRAICLQADHSASACKSTTDCKWVSDTSFVNGLPIFDKYVDKLVDDIFSLDTQSFEKQCMSAESKVRSPWCAEQEGGQSSCLKDACTVYMQFMSDNHDKTEQEKRKLLKPLVQVEAKKRLLFDQPEEIKDLLASKVKGLDDASATSTGPGNCLSISELHFVATRQSAAKYCGTKEQAQGNEDKLYGLEICSHLHDALKTITNILPASWSDGIISFTVRMVAHFPVALQEVFVAVSKGVAKTITLIAPSKGF